MSTEQRERCLCSRAGQKKRAPKKRDPPKAAPGVVYGDNRNGDNAYIPAMHVKKIKSMYDVTTQRGPWTHAHAKSTPGTIVT